MVTPYTITYNGNPQTATGTATAVTNVNLSGDLNLTGTTHSLPGVYSDNWASTTPTVIRRRQRHRHRHDQRPPFSVEGDIFVLNQTASGALAVSATPSSTSRAPCRSTLPRQRRLSSL